MRRFCLMLKLRPEPELIAEYIELHREGRPVIHESIRTAGVLDMQIYEHSGQLFMVMDTTDEFTFEQKAALDRANPEVQAWERLMERFQDVAEGAEFGERWVPMRKIFQLRQAE